MSSLRDSFRRLLRADPQSRPAKTVEVFGWLILIEGSVILLAPHIVVSLLCGSGSWGGQRLSLAPYVTGTEPTDGATAAGGRLSLYSPATTGNLLPGFYRRTASNVLQPEPRSMAPTVRFFCATL